jgi:hypothetical protein
MSVIIDGYPLDLAVSESYTRESEASKFPQEKGADITDHVRTGPRMIEFEGIVSDTPIGAIAEHITRQLESGVPQSPSQYAFKFLEGLQDTPRLVTIECSLGKFENMLLVSLSVPRNAQNTKGLQFTVGFEQITLAVNERTTVRTAVPNGHGRANLGNRESAFQKAISTDEDVDYVQSLPVANRASYKWLGAPILTSDPEERAEWNNEIGTDEAEGKLDHYKVQGQMLPDGYVRVRKGKKQYIRLSPGERIDLPDELTGSRFDHSTGTWRAPGGRPVTKTPPKPDKWRKTTVSQRSR